MSLSILRFICAAKKYNNKIERSKNLPKCLSLIVTVYILYSRFKINVISCRKYVILERPSWKLPSALSQNCVSIFIYFCINICFCIKQANKICTLLSSHLLALIVFSVQCFCFTKAYMFLVTHPDTNPAEKGLTLVNFSITNLSDAQRARLNLW